ncbi:lipopolysaccharide biosynthesis protein [Piscinibacter sp.]|uniref:lipopolysaccharide biosynthesis protein n=1 Tax=Piscinibacter sp. TaxID=1903157 RepID=UPI002B9D8BF6|nr:lipopolysaccharide biosynthesis protein [Albitalea sp.]HUG24360.1 lipopolysaccharide biosynthesis protein [Albitalea sp.]
MNASLKSDTVLYGAAVMAERVLGLLLLPLLTRELTTAEYGVWAQTLVVSSVLMPLVLFCLPAAIVKFFAAGVAVDERRQWMRRTLVLAGTLFGVLAVAGWSARESVAAAVYGDGAQAAFVPVLIVLLGADALLDLLIAYLRAAFRMRSIALLMLARGVLRFGFLLAALSVLGLSFLPAFVALAVLQLTIVLFAFLFEMRRGGRPTSQDAAAAPDWHTMLAFAAPLVLVSVLTSVNTFADRFVLTHLLGLDRLAVYAAVSSLVSIANVAYTVLGFTLFPVLSRLWAQGDSAGAIGLARDTVRVFLFMALPYALWLACVIDSLLPLMATQAYRASAEVPLLLGLGAIGYGLYQIMLYLLLLRGHGMRAAWLMLLAALLNIGLNLLLVPRFGLSGAAGAAALSNGALAVGAYVAARAQFPWDSAMRTAIGSGLAAAVALAMSRWVAPASWAGVGLSLLLAGALYLAVDLAAGRSVLRAFIGPKATS